MKSLKYLLLGLVILLFTQLNAQDKIYTRSGNEVKAKKIKKDNDLIVFTHYDDDISIRSFMKKNKVDSIVYENGKIEHFEIAPYEDYYKSQRTGIQLKDIKPVYSNPDSRLKITNGFFSLNYYHDLEKISKGAFMRILQTNSKAYNLYKYGSSQDRFGNILGFPAGFYFGYNLRRKIDGRRVNNAGLVASLIVGVISISYNIKGKKKKQKAVRLYNLENIKSESIIIRWEGNKLIFNF